MTHDDLADETVPHPSGTFTGWWLILADQSAIGPYDTKAEATEAMLEDNPFVEIDPTTTDVAYLTATIQINNTQQGEKTWQPN